MVKAAILATMPHFLFILARIYDSMLHFTPNSCCLFLSALPQYLTAQYFVTAYMHVRAGHMIHLQSVVFLYFCP